MCAICPGHACIAAADTMRPQQQPLRYVVTRRGKACCSLVLLTAQAGKGTHKGTAFTSRAAVEGCLYSLRTLLSWNATVR